MKTTTKTLLSTATSVIALLGSSAAFAQTTTPPPANDTTTADDAQAIVVTGSLIRNPNLVQANPVNVTTADQIELKQSNTAEDVLREVPGIVANIGSAVNNGNGGSSYVDLRGLGSNRNIVLLDGNRIVPADLAGRVDLNNIPLALISRVDALTGAAVTTYGADAITGVVNFITKKDFAGLDLSASNQITEKGDGNYFRADLTLGANFDDGRGNAVLSIGYQNSDPVYQGARDFSINQISSFTGGGAGSGTAVPGRFTGTRIIDPLTGKPSINPAVPNSGAAQIQGNGATAGRFDAATGKIVGTLYAPFNFNPYNVFQTPFNRYNIFAQANYQVSDAVEVYTRALFSKNTVDTIIAPSGSFGGTVVVNLNNPFLPAALRNQFCAFNTTQTTPGLYTPRFDQATCDAAALATGPNDTGGPGGTNRYRTVTTALSRRTPEVGPRISNYSTQIFDYRVGARGAITSNVNWDLNASYGESDKIQTIKGYTLQSRFRQGALVNGTAANPVCQDTSNSCVPVNFFGDVGSITPAAAKFLNAQSTTQVKTSLTQVRGLISGDLGFSFPSASQPISFALGSEYRKYTAIQASDVLAKTPGELGGAGGAAPDINGGYRVYEGYGELVVPVIGDILTLEGGARYSHQVIDRGPSNNSWTYKGGVTFQPIPDIKFRGNYARAVRAPNIGELFTPLTTGLTNLGVDKCAGTAPVTNANLRAVCIAQGAPAGTIGAITNPTAGQANITSGGNINLRPEKATTYTAGVVIQPSFLPRFNLSVDYYNIKVKDVIGTPLPGDLIGACFNNVTAASATDPNCTVIRRNPITGNLDGDPATTFGLLAPINNLGKLYTDGVDVIANYNTNFFGLAKWAINFSGNYTRHSKYQATPSALNRECVGYYSVNCSFTGSIQPKYQWSLRNTFSVDRVDLSLLWRHISAVNHEPADIVDQGLFFAGTLPASTGPVAGRTVDFNHIKAENYFDATVRFNATDNFTFTFTAQNVLNQQPPIVGNTAGSTTYNSGNIYPSTYDALGRRYAVSAKLKF